MFFFFFFFSFFTFWFSKPKASYPNPTTPPSTQPYINHLHHQAKSNFIHQVMSGKHTTRFPLYVILLDIRRRERYSYAHVDRDTLVESNNAGSGEDVVSS